MRGFSISQIAQASNVNVETIKYYLKRNLITQPSRNESGYRVFTEDTIEEICFIKNAQSIGLSLSEIQHLMTWYKNEDAEPSPEMHEFAIAKVNEIEQQVQRLQHFKALLQQITESAKLPMPKQDCPVLKQILKGGKEHGETN